MRKAVILVGAIVGFTLLARRAAHKCGCVDFAKMIERMPEAAPPKWMFRNISAIRENTEKILEKLESESAPEEFRTPTASYAASAD